MEQMNYKILNYEHDKIKSVQRLSDGEVFSVGDKIIYTDIQEEIINIKSIQLFNGEILIHKDCTMNTNELSEIKHFKK